MKKLIFAVAILCTGCASCVNGTFDAVESDVIASMENQSPQLTKAQLGELDNYCAILAEYFGIEGAYDRLPYEQGSMLAFLRMCFNFESFDDTFGETDAYEEMWEWIVTNNIKID